MPNYSYLCNSCSNNFELFYAIKNYIEKPPCPYCSSSDTLRNYILDVSTQASSVKKSDSELKTIGDLALRNSERLSDDEKIHLYKKHNDYKENKEETKPLPHGMSRMKKPPKLAWPGSSLTKKRRNTKK